MAECKELLAPNGCAAALPAAPAGGILTQDQGLHLPIGYRGNPFPRIYTGSGRRRLGRALRLGSEASAQPELGRLGVPGASASVAATLPGARAPRPPGGLLYPLI